RWLSGDPRHMWCHGAPGSGKTVITSIVVNHLRQLFSGKQEVGIAVLYCEWRQQEVQSRVNLLASIWNQLVVDKPLSMEVEALYKKTGSRVKPRYHDVLSILKREIERLSSVYIILDALDELAEHNDCSKVLVEALSRLTPVSSQKVRILATSRSKRSVLARSELVHIVAKGEDIERFVEARFQQGISSSDDLSCRARDDQALKETMVVAIGKRANGLFLLARLFLDTLKHKTNLRDLRGAVQKLPQSINEQYVETWKRIEQQNLEHRDLGKRILSWLVHAIRPLTLQELSHALATRKGDKCLDIECLDAHDSLLTCCHGLVIIDDKTQIIRLVHYSTQEYLGHCDFEYDDSYHGGLHPRINATRVAKWRFLPRRLARFPFLQYAASNWGRHAVGEVELSHQTEILAFLHERGSVMSAAQVQNKDWLHEYWENLDDMKSVPLFVCCSFGLEHITAMLLNEPNDFDVNARLGWRGNIVLHDAVELGKPGLIGLLLNAGADPLLKESRSASGFCPSVLYKAIANGHSDIVAMLLSPGHNRLIEPSTIYCATYRENASIIESMIACPEDETRRGELLRQFLFHAAALGRTSVINLATRLGANLETKDANGQTALCLAVRHGRPAAVELLLKTKASTAAQDAFEPGLLQLSASSRELIEERMRYIRSYGVEYAGIPSIRRDERTKEERPPSMGEPLVFDDTFMQEFSVLLDTCHRKEIHQPSKLKDLIFDDSDHLQILKMLLDCAVDVNELDSEGESVLHYAVKVSSERVRALLESSRDRLNIDLPDTKGRTPLHYAAAMGSTETMELLLEYGANIALKDKDLATTLHFSAKSIACTKLTIDRGVVLDSEDSFGRTALNYAWMVKGPNGEVRDVLFDAGAKEKKFEIRLKPGQGSVIIDGIQYQNAEFSSPEVICWINNMADLGYTELVTLYRALENYSFNRDWGNEPERDKITSELLRSADKINGVKWTRVSDSEDEDLTWRRA
ncbi:MAG: hypothetical protein Q9180_003837, partial [Flavoplaca navasiana]